MDEKLENAPDVVQNDKNETSALDDLRTSIEHDCRFRTSLSGYNKNDVQKYLKTASGRFQEALNEQNEKHKKLEKENGELYVLLAEQKKKLAEVRTEERRKLQAEYNMQEGLVESLREKNGKLMADNQAKQIEITALKEQINGFRSVNEERSKQLDKLSCKLEELLSAKFRECGDVINIWKSEFRNTVEAEGKQITAP